MLPIQESFEYRLQKGLWQIANLVYPPACAGCGTLGQVFCQQCASQTIPLAGRLCQKCGDPISRGEMCPDCLAHPPSYHQLRALAEYKGPIRNGLRKLKYKGDLGLGFALAPMLAQFAHGLEFSPDLVCAVPLGKDRLRERGYNQVDALAKPMASLLGWRFSTNAVWRVRETRSQVGLGVRERRENVRNAFEADPGQVAGKKILLVDDTTTTGATLDFASWSIIKAGATIVTCIAYAKATAQQDQPI